MLTVSLDEVVKDLSGYLRRVRSGETVIITEANEPVVEMRPVPSSAPEGRPFGLAAGEFTVPDDFDAPLPDDVLRAFSGE